MQKQQRHIKQAIRRLAGVQLLISGILALFFLLFEGVVPAYSVIIGGLIVTLPDLWFARQFFAYSGAQQAKQMMKAFYKGKTLKLLVTIVLMVVALKFLAVSATPLLAGYIVAVLTFWFTPKLFSGPFSSLSQEANS